MTNRPPGGHAVWRFAVAVACSACAHGALLFAFDAPGSRPGTPDRPQLFATLVPLPAQAGATPVPAPSLQGHARGLKPPTAAPSADGVTPTVAAAATREEVSPGSSGRVEVSVSLEPGVYGLRPPFLRDGVRYLDYGSHDLERQPRAQADLRVDYPLPALIANATAWVVVQLFIDSGGRVEEASRVCGAPLFAEAVAAAAREIRFDPAEHRGGAAVHSTVVVEVAFLGRDAPPGADEYSLEHLRASLQQACLREIFGTSRRAP